MERLYGIQNGSIHFQGNQHKEVVTNKSEAPTFTQEQLASQMGMSVDTLQNYKLLAEMIPELEELLDTGIVTKTTALAIMKNLSNQEQEELISSLDTTRRITQTQMQKYIDEIKAATNLTVIRRKIIYHSYSIKSSPFAIYYNKKKDHRFCAGGLCINFIRQGTNRHQFLCMKSICLQEPLNLLRMSFFYHEINHK